MTREVDHERLRAALAEVVAAAGWDEGECTIIEDSTLERRLEARFWKGVTVGVTIAVVFNVILLWPS